MNNVVVEYFAEPIKDADLREFNAKKGISKHMTLWESLALLLAARTWLVRSPGSAIEVRSDSLGALRMMSKMASKSSEVNKIAQELALDWALDKYTVRLLRHTPGIANTVPDILSRIYSPEPKPVPIFLNSAKEVTVPARTSAFWLARQYS